MADAAVEVLFGNLKELLLHHSYLIASVRSQLELLDGDLRFIRAFLKEASKKQGKDATTQALVGNIRDVVYEAEDVVDELVTMAASSKTRNPLARVFKSPVNLHDVGARVEEVRKKIKRIIENESASIAVADEDGPGKYEELVRHNLVGFEDEMSTLIGYLTQESQELDVITLVGMPGSGKTSLAYKIFVHPDIREEFRTCIWVRAADESRRDVLLSMLRQLGDTMTNDTKKKDDGKLSERVVTLMEGGGKFLIVFDDVWSVGDWDRLRVALPNQKGKVLITSCNEEVGWRASPARGPHKLRFLNESESWKLLQMEVFGEFGSCPPELEAVGKLISEGCNGLPLALVAMAGALSRAVLEYGDNKLREAAWISIGQSIPEFRHTKFYDNLPAHLQVCFLSLAAFPLGYEIPMGRLARIWIAEGFVAQRGGASLEETAESYVEALIGRNLLEIAKMGANGKAKTCRIHRMLHGFCKAEAGYQGENLLTEIKYGDHGFEPPIRELHKYRRLSIHSKKILEFVSSKPVAPHVRSFYCFARDSFTLDIPTILSASKLLRVLDVQPLEFTRIHRDMYQLVHLRYLAFSLHLSILPAKFTQLGNIQTLLIHTPSRTLDIRADIFRLTRLRHFKTNASAYLAKPGKSSDRDGNLQSLGMVSPESCTEEVLDRARNLKKLGIRGRLSVFLDRNGSLFDKLSRLERLGNLKLLNDVYPDQPSQVPLPGLLEAKEFPPRLESLTLVDTYLDWSQMSILENLKNLAVLKLKHRAFTGEIWKPDGGGFLNLEALHIDDLDFGIWKASSHHFPKLRSLRLRHCEQLQEVPIELAEIPSLQLLELVETRLAAPSAERLRQKKEKSLKESGMDAKMFELSIYPK